MQKHHQRSCLSRGVSRSRACQCAHREALGPRGPAACEDDPRYNTDGGTAADAGDTDPSLANFAKFNDIRIFTIVCFESNREGERGMLRAELSACRVKPKIH